MIDSCRPSKLDPGLPAAYSIPRSRRTCTMRSEPGRTTARWPGRTGGRTLPASRSSCAGEGGGAASGETFVPCAETAPASGPLVNAAAPAAAVAAPFRNPRRVTGCCVFFVLAIFEPLPKARQPEPGCDEMMRRIDRQPQPEGWGRWSNAPATIAEDNHHRREERRHVVAQSRDATQLEQTARTGPR